MVRLELVRLELVRLESVRLVLSRLEQTGVIFGRLGFGFTNLEVQPRVSLLVSQMAAEFWIQIKPFRLLRPCWKCTIDLICSPYFGKRQ